MKIDLSSLKFQTLLALGFFALCVIIFVIFYRPPSIERIPKIEVENVSKENFTQIIQNATCKEYMEFKYGRIDYEYLIISTFNGKIITTKMKVKGAGTEEREGKIYHVSEVFSTTNYEGKEYNASGKIYMDENFSCVFQEFTTYTEGKEYKYQQPCEETQQKLCKDFLDYLGNETIKTDAGIFNTEVYKIKNTDTKLYISNEVGIPIKIESKNLKMELLSYKR